MRSIRRRLLAIVVATGAAALAAPVSGASAQIAPFDFGVPGLGAVMVGGNQIGSAGCIGTNRPAVGGNNGSTSAQACGGVSSAGSHIGQIVTGLPGLGTNVVNSPFTEVNVSEGSITQVGP
ncbi:MAG: hypothetical protein JWO02_1586 [Solirubrobacterales bacterium]|nr:hypothetical protein [Solirubrobacterales bacterium]